MKAIALGILGSVVCLNLLVATLKASSHSAPADPQARIAALEAQVAELRTQVAPTDQQREFMVRDEDTGAWRDLYPGEIGRISGRLDAQTVGMLNRGMR